MSHNVSRRSVLIGAALLPLAGVIGGATATQAAAEPAGYGKLVKTIKGNPNQRPDREFTAKVFERGITVTRRGLSMS